jgi:hypothetical protein
MNILIVYTPRSASTYLHNILAKKFNLTGLNDLLTHTRINHGDDMLGLPSAIEQINQQENICVKVNGHDFIDLKNKTITDDYKKINYQKFDHIIFLHRSNFIDALLSYSYMDRHDTSSWHRKKGQPKILKTYTISKEKIYFLSRGYRVYNIIQDYILKNYTGSVLHYEFNTVVDKAQQDFALTPGDFESDTESNNLNYRSLLQNIEILEQANTVFNLVGQTTIFPQSEFWYGV